MSLGVCLAVAADIIICQMAVRVRIGFWATDGKLGAFKNALT